MAVRIEGLRDQILLILYDYMLTSDHESFWFNIPAIQDALSSETPGAFVERAVSSLIAAKLVEQGGSNPLRKDLFALTEHGIRQAETLISKAGISVEEYEPAPSADVILTRLENPDEFKSLAEGFQSLRQEIASSNSAAEVLEDDKDVFLTELDAASTMVGSDRVRVSRLNALILPPLRYLAAKFRDQAIGEAAKRLIQLLIGLI